MANTCVKFDASNATPRRVRVIVSSIFELVFFFAEHTRNCSYCKKSIRGSTSKILSNNYGKHARTHGFSNAKAMDAHVLEYKHESRASSTHVPGGGGDAGFGGDFGGGDFGGGFGDDDQGAQDDRFESVDDEPAGDGEAKVTLAVALKDPGTRNILRFCPEFWRVNSDRARVPLSEKAKTTYFGQASSALDMLAAPGRELVPRVSLLTADSTAAEVQRFACQAVETLDDLVPIQHWAKKLETKAIGSTAVALHMLARLFGWATAQLEKRLAAELGVAVEPPRLLVLGRVTIASLPDVVAKARAASHMNVLAKRAAAQMQTNSWQKMVDALIGLAAFKEQCEASLEKLITSGHDDEHERLQELSIEELQAVALACLVGAGDFPALRINVGNSRAADAGKSIDHKMTVLRTLDGRIMVQVVDKQKGHIMAPIDISESAPATAKVLGALLDREDFEHGGPICRAVDGDESRLITELRYGAELADFGAPPAVLVGVGVKGLQFESNTFRRWYATVGFVAMLWGLISVIEFAGICYVQQHDPKMSINTYMKLQGLKELMPKGYEEKSAEARQEYRKKTTPDAKGIVPQQEHNALTRAMWSALTKLRLMCTSIKDRDSFVCPKCNDQAGPADIAAHVAECLGGLNSYEAGLLLDAQRRERIEAADESLDDSGDYTDTDSDSGDVVDSAGRGGKRKAAVDASRNIRMITSALTRDVGATNDDDESFDVDVLLSSEESSADDDSGENDSDEDDSSVQTDHETLVVVVPRAALDAFEHKAAHDRNEVLALLVSVDDNYELLFLNQMCSNTSCVHTDTGNVQLATETERGHVEVLAWVHSHPGHDQFLSHIDVHTQKEWQQNNDGLFALVWAPDRVDKWGAYNLNEEQMSKANECEQNNGSATLGNDCVGVGEPKNYTRADIHLTDDKCTVVDKRKD
jgi:proteasome lid subunit RPN8/RPN11